MKIFLLILRLVLAGVFLAAGILKASASEQFAVALIPFTFLPPSFIGPIAAGLPVVETLTGALLIAPWASWRRAGACAALVLCVAFIATLGWALANGIIVSCSCFGRDETPSAAKMAVTLGRDVLLALAAGALLFEDRLTQRPRTPDTARKTPASG